jgi:hypothetical protein
MDKATGKRKDSASSSSARTPRRRRDFRPERKEVRARSTNQRGAFQDRPGSRRRELKFSPEPRTGGRRGAPASALSFYFLSSGPGGLSFGTRSRSPERPEAEELELPVLVEVDEHLGGLLAGHGRGEAPGRAAIQ